MAKKVLLMGGTGAMGVYLVPELQKLGYHIDVTTRSPLVSEIKNVRYLQGDAHNLDFIKKVLAKTKYDAVVDFMTYTTDEFRERFTALIGGTQQYLFLSSYRVFADSNTITEESPRLLDVVDDAEYLSTDEYALTKARQENIIKASRYKNWTIIRPAITYSKTRFQLGVMEADVLIWRALQGVPVILPKNMLDKVTTLTWAGDVARMIAGLVSNKKAFGEDFNVATSKNYTWAEVAAIYDKVIGLKIKTSTLDEYIEAMGGGYRKYQVNYDRMFNRKIDNSKVLHVTGIKQEELTDLCDGLRRELTQFIQNPEFSKIDYKKQARIDKLTHTKSDLSYASAEDKVVYQESRYPQITRIRSRLRPRTRLKSIARKLKNKTRIRTRFKKHANEIRSWKTRKIFKTFDGAILTLNGYFNYGNIIQRYALQKFLQDNGHKFVSYERGPLNVGASDSSKFHYTSEFIQKNIVRKNFDQDDNFSAYIVGSDQVWRNWGMPEEKGDLKYYFLSFIKKPKTKRISYAASFGVGTLKEAGINSKVLATITPLVSKFDAISVREESGVNIVHKTWAKQAKLVLDPTMLLTKIQYSSIIEGSPIKLESTSPVFGYILAVTDDKKKIIKNSSEQFGGLIDYFFPKQFDVLPPVEQWLKGFRDAKLVVTDSFHGTVFSIINNTPFVVIENEFGGVARITSLLDTFGLGDRMVSESNADSFDYSALAPINWSEVNGRLEDLRNSSGLWLLEALKNGGS